MSNTIVVKDLLQREVIQKLDEKTVIMPIANRKYEGQLREQGTTVTVQNFPNREMVHGGTAGDDITAVDWAVTSEDLTVDQVFQDNAKVKDIEKIQSNLDLMGNLADRIAQAKAETYDNYIASFSKDALAANKVVDLAPATLAADTVVAAIEAMRVKLSTQNAFMDSHLFVNPAIASLIRQSNMYSGFDSGLKFRESAKVGRIAGFNVLETNNLPAKRKIAIGAAVTADDTISFTDGTDTVTFTAKAAPSNAGEFDVAGNKGDQQTIVQNMINGTGTTGATSYIELSAADRKLMKKWLVNCGDFSSDAAALTARNGTTFAVSMTSGSNLLGTASVVMFAASPNSINFVNQEDGMKVTENTQGFSYSILTEDVYGGTVFAENSKSIATYDITNGA